MYLKVLATDCRTFPAWRSGRCATPWTARRRRIETPWRRRAGGRKMRTRQGGDRIRSTWKAGRRKSNNASHLKESDQTHYSTRRTSRRACAHTPALGRVPATKGSDALARSIQERAGHPGMRARIPALGRVASHPGRSAHARASQSWRLASPSWRQHLSSGKEAIVPTKPAIKAEKLSQP